METTLPVQYYCSPTSVTGCSKKMEEREVHTCRLLGARNTQHPSFLPSFLPASLLQAEVVVGRLVVRSDRIHSIDGPLTGGLRLLGVQVVVALDTAKAIGAHRHKALRQGQ